MAFYRIEWKKSAAKELRNIPKENVSQIIKKVESLSAVPIPVGNKKLSGSEKIYRIKVGTYRIIYEIEKKELTILIIRIRHRREAYR